MTLKRGAERAKELHVHLAMGKSGGYKVMSPCQFLSTQRPQCLDCVESMLVVAFHLPVHWTEADYRMDAGRGGSEGSSG